MAEQESRTVTLGLVQSSVGSDLKRNLNKTMDSIRLAADRGAQIICLQELFQSRYFCQTHDDSFFQWAEVLPGPTTEALGDLAREKEVVIVSSLFEKADDKFFNTAVVLDADGSYLGKYRKVHIPDDPENYYSEKYYFSPGDLGFRSFETRFAKIGVQVCWDQWFPEGARALALQGAEILFYPTAIGWPVEGIGEVGQAELDAWFTVQRGHAVSNNVFVAATNRVGTEDHLKFWGASFVADPLGRVLGQASIDQEEILVVACDLNRIEEVRKDWPFLSCRRLDSYSQMSQSFPNK